MPIKISSDLPAFKTLTDENIFVMDEARASSQDIRALQIAIVNLMPTKITTETQLLRLLGNSPLQIELEFIQMASHVSKNVSQSHMEHFYKTFEEIKDRKFDGMIITGAPVELMEYEEVDYWDELCKIFEWSKTHVYSTFHICWGAQAALFYHYGIKKYLLPKKLFGIYSHHVDRQNTRLFRGSDDKFYVPHSRYTECRREDIEKHPELRIFASSPEAGVLAVTTEGARQIFIMGHCEYDRDTLDKEYKRDIATGLDTDIPKNYYPNNDFMQEPVMNWRAHANLLYYNWLNYFVYQSTPYDINEIH